MAELTATHMLAWLWDRLVGQQLEQQQGQGQEQQVIYQDRGQGHAYINLQSLY